MEYTITPPPQEPTNLNDAVRNLQRYLRALSFDDERINRVPIDGIYEAETAKAVRAFQRTRGLPETGIVNKETWDTLFSEFSRLSAARDRSNNINLFPTSPRNYEAAKGDASSFISLVQFILNELSVIYNGLGELKTDGSFDEDTEMAIKRFQVHSGLPPTGRVDLITWNRLIRDFSNYSI